MPAVAQLAGRPMSVSIGFVSSCARIGVHAEKVYVHNESWKSWWKLEKKLESGLSEMAEIEFRIWVA